MTKRKPKLFQEPELLNYAVRALGGRAHSTGELREKLRRRAERLNSISAHKHHSSGDGRLVVLASDVELLWLAHVQQLKGRGIERVQLVVVGADIDDAVGDRRRRSDCAAGAGGPRF